MKKIFRKIHLWISVPFGLLITVICFSGAMMVFEKEITELCRRDVYFVKEADSRGPLEKDVLLQMVQAELPDSVSVTGVVVPENPRRAWQFNLSRPRRASVYVNPYTGEITGRSGKLPFFDTMFRLHRWLLGSAQSKNGGMPAGKLIVGISTIAMVIILLTGLLMWLTNRKKPLAKSLTVSFTKGWPRFLHDLHVAGGIYASLFLLAIALTGLTWSFSWYRNAAYGLFGAKVEVRETPRQTVGKDAGQTVDRAADRNAKVRTAFYSIHTGKWGGWVTKIIYFLAALLGATLPLTGYYLWIKRLVKKNKAV